MIQITTMLTGNVFYYLFYINFPFGRWQSHEKLPLIQNLLVIWIPNLFSFHFLEHFLHITLQ